MPSSHMFQPTLAGGPEHIWLNLLFTMYGDQATSKKSQTFVSTAKDVQTIIKAGTDRHAYDPVIAARNLVELDGIEPTT